MKTVKATRFLKEGGEWVDRRWVHLERGETDRYRLGHESVTKGFKPRWLNVQSGLSESG